MIEQVKDRKMCNEPSIVFVETDIDKSCVGSLDPDLIMLRHMVVLPTVLYSEVKSIRHCKGKEHLQRPSVLIKPHTHDSLIFFKDGPSNSIKLIVTPILSFKLHQNLFNFLHLTLQMMYHLLLLTFLGKVVLWSGEVRFLSKQQFIQLRTG